MFVVTARKDQGGKLASFDTTSVDALCICIKLKTALGIMTIDNGGALFLLEEGLVLVPDLGLFSIEELWGCGSQIRQWYGEWV